MPYLNKKLEDIVVKVGETYNFFYPKV